jgi:hypothetical protein
MKQSSHRYRDSILLALVGLALAACGGDPAVTPPPAQDPATMYWQLTLNVRAATMSTVAPYDTLQLVATPRTVHGTPITDLPAATFTSLDLDRAQVDSTGLVHVIGSGDQVAIVASLEQNNVLHSDTLVMNITDESSPPTMATFTIHPDVGDSAKVGSSTNATVLPRAYTADGTPIPDVAVYFSTSDVITATINRTTGFLTPDHPGHVDVYATTTTYGVTKVDTLPYTIGHPIILVLDIPPKVQPNGQTIPVFSPDSAELGPGAYVLFGNELGPATDVTFDDPTNVAQEDEFCALAESLCGSGNIAPWTFDPNDPSGLSAIRVRQFNVPGVYTYHSALFGSTGVIVIADESTH